MPFNDTNTKLLLHAQGDQSASGAEVTFGAGVTIKDFGGSDIPVVGSSTYLSGSSRLELAYSADFEFSGTFTIEAYIMLRRVGQEQHLVSGQYILAAYKGWCFYLNASNLLVFRNAAVEIVVGSTPLVVDQWYHVAVSRDSSLTVNLFLDGVNDGSASYSASLIADQGINIGDRLNYGDAVLARGYKGYITAVNISSACLYSVPFTPVKYADNLVNDSQTKLLLDFTEVQQGGTTAPVDSSSSGAKTVTAVSINNITFWWGQVYYFDGVGSYAMSVSEIFTPVGTADFSISFWLKTEDTNAAHRIFSFGNYYLSTAASGYNSLRKSNDDYLLQRAGYAWYSLSIPIHVEISRVSGSWRIFKNGVSVGQYSSNNDTSEPNIGNILGLKGWLTDFHVTTGSSVAHTASFTPPKSLSTLSANSRLLLQPGGNSAIATRLKSISINGTPLIPQEADTNFNQSFKLNGTSDFIEVPDSGDFNFG